MTRSKRAAATATPAFVAALLEWRAVWFVARLLLVSAYLLGGVTKLMDWNAAVAEQAHFGMDPPAFWAALTIAVEILGPALILIDRFVWLGAGMLGTFTFLAAFVANRFWTLQGQERFTASNAFFEHMGLMGGFIIVAILSHRARRVQPK